MIPVTLGPVTDPGDPWLGTHVVEVETYNSEGFNGAGYAPPATRVVGLEESTQMGRDSSGDEATIAGRIFAVLSMLQDFTPETRVTIRPGRTARVTAVDVFDSRDPDLAELDHIEVQFV